MCLLSQSVRRPCGVSVLIRQLSVPKTVKTSRKMQKTLGTGFKWRCFICRRRVLSGPATFESREEGIVARLCLRETRQLTRADGDGVRVGQRVNGRLEKVLLSLFPPFNLEASRSRHPSLNTQINAPLKLSAALLFTRLDLFIESITANGRKLPEAVELQPL